MRYERPMIVRWERIEALLSPVSIISDVASKENVVAVAW
jgi:hypothetical protein